MTIQELADKVKGRLPDHAEVKPSKHYNSDAVEVVCDPAMSDGDFQDFTTQLLSEYDDHIAEIYTEETGHHFFVYPKVVSEGETHEYEPPKYAVKPYPGDTGFALVKKHYNRFLWATRELATKTFDRKVYESGNIKNWSEYNSIHEAENSLDAPYLGEIPGMGSPDATQDRPVGYMKRGDNELEVPTDMFEDPDKRKEEEKEQMRHIKRFKNFDPTPQEKVDGEIQKKKNKEEEEPE